MPSIRIGFSTDLNLVNEQVGIGTTNPTARLDVRGQIIADRTTGGGGITTLTTYDGFLQSQQTLGNAVSIASTTKGNLNSISGEIKVSAEVTVSDGTPVAAGRLDSLTVTGTFDLPSSGTLGRETTPEKGTTRYNEDLGQLEFYTGYEWRTVGSYDGSGRGRGVICATGGGTQTIEYVTISTLGNASYFGDAIFSGGYRSGSSSSTRGLFSGGLSGPASSNVIEYATLASQGNNIDFGDLTVARYGSFSLSSETRSLTAGGYATTPGAYNNTIDYVQISTIGNAVDFGDLNRTKAFISGCSSSTRGLYGGLQFGSTDNTERSILRITIASKGDSQDFGFLSARRDTSSAAVSNGTRAIFAGGEFRDGGAVSGGESNTIDYVLISSDGNAVDFGDLTVARRHMCAVQSITRGVFAGGSSSGNTIDYITITTSGNAQDFGDLSKSGRTHNNGASDSHGGLGGF
jgi:hypothetical protein